jgi:hypothetical protein
MFGFRNVVEGYNLFGGLIPMWVVMKEGFSWGFYLFKCFIEDS